MKVMNMSIIPQSFIVSACNILVHAPPYCPTLARRQVIWFLSFSFSYKGDTMVCQLVFFGRELTLAAFPQHNYFEIYP